MEKGLVPLKCKKTIKNIINQKKSKKLNTETSIKEKLAECAFDVLALNFLSQGKQRKHLLVKRESKTALSRTFVRHMRLAAVGKHAEKPAKKLLLESYTAMLATPTQQTRNFGYYTYKDHKHKHKERNNYDIQQQ